jgi:micrococcal nuclease
MRARIVIALFVVVALVGFTTSDPAGAPSASEPNAAPRDDTVVRVVDGDTVVLRAAGKSRLIGVDTPEVFGRPGCFGAEASEFSKRTLLPGRRVRVRRGAEPHDRYDRYLRVARGVCDRG